MENNEVKKNEAIQDAHLSPEEIADVAGGSFLDDIASLVKRGVCAVSGHSSSTTESFEKSHIMYTKYQCDTCGQWIYEKRYYTANASEEISEAEYNAAR